MKIILVTLLLVASALARPQSLADIRSAPPVERVELRDDRNQFSEMYHTLDGQYVAESGQLNPRGDGDYVLEKSGTYQYLSPEGIPFRVDWKADRFGFRPSGKHINVPV